MEGLKKWRDRKGLSQKEVAISIGVAPPQISKWEAGVTEPTLDNLIKLSEIYEITLDEIVGRSHPYSAITHEEISLLRVFRQLNQSGQIAVQSVAEGLLSQADMRKESTIASAI